LRFSSSKSLQGTFLKSLRVVLHEVSSEVSVVRTQWWRRQFWPQSLSLGCDPANYKKWGGACAATYISFTHSTTPWGAPPQNKMKLGLETEVLNIQTVPALPTLQCQFIFKLVDLGTTRCNFANWVTKLATSNSQFPNWQLPVSKLSNGQSLLYFPPGALETANYFTNFTNFVNSVAKVATGNSSQFLNCQLKPLRKSICEFRTQVLIATAKRLLRKSIGGLARSVSMSDFQIPYIRMYLPYIPYNAVFRIYRERNPSELNQNRAILQLLKSYTPISNLIVPENQSLKG